MRIIKHIIDAVFLSALISAASLTLSGIKYSIDAGKTVAEPEDEEMFVSVVFAGDIMQHMPQIEAAKVGDNAYSYIECFSYMAPLFQDSDLAVINLETTLSKKPPYSGYPEFCAPAQLAGGLKESGIDVVLLANNHICDKGGRGLDGTVNIIDSVGLYHTGAFKDSLDYKANNPLTVERNGFKISILNYTYGTNDIRVPRGRIVNKIDTAAIARDLAKIEPGENNLTFVCIHWGEEYDTWLSSDQRTISRWLRSKGVDFVIGSHPHIVQQVQTHKDTVGNIHGATVYSLGNFVSNQRTTGTDGGLVVRLNITKRKGEKATVLPEYAFVWNYKPVINGKTRYFVVPSYDADSLLQHDKTVHDRYNAFVRKAKRTIGTKSGFREITEFVEKDRTKIVTDKEIKALLEQPSKRISGQQ